MPNASKDFWEMLLDFFARKSVQSSAARAPRLSQQHRTHRVAVDRPGRAVPPARATTSRPCFGGRAERG